MFYSFTPKKKKAQKYYFFSFDRLKMCFYNKFDPKTYSHAYIQLEMYFYTNIHAQYFNECACILPYCCSDWILCK